MQNFRPDIKKGEKGEDIVIVKGIIVNIEAIEKQPDASK